MNAEPSPARDPQATLQVQEDIGFVRSVVQRAQEPGTPLSIYILWAAIVAAGFTLADLAPQWIGRYWMVAGPGGWLLSGLFGWRSNRRRGTLDTRRGARYALHWAAMVVAMFLAVLMPLRGLMDWEALGHLSLLLVALAYFLSGVHLERATLWLGPWMLLAYGLALYLPAWPWTAAGAVAALGLLATPLLGGSRRVAAV